MSVANVSTLPPSLQEESRAHEPSMEEILASIRRIIADDQILPVSRREREERSRRDAGEDAAHSTAQSAFSEQDSLEQEMSEQEVEAAPAEAHDEIKADSAPVVGFAPQPAAVADIRQLRLNRATPAPVAPVEEDAQEVEEEDYSAVALVSAAAEPEEPYEPAVEEALLSVGAASSVSSHFQALAASMIIKDSGLLQQYAQEMMRPMLKQWLDDNLPVIVERLVRAEIERVARGGRR